jgi:hypothetical protein
VKCSLTRTCEGFIRLWDRSDTASDETKDLCRNMKALERTDFEEKSSAEVSEQKTVNKRFLERSPTYASKTNRDYAQARACDTGVDRRIRTGRATARSEICPLGQVKSFRGEIFAQQM